MKESEENTIEKHKLLVIEDSDLDERNLRIGLTQNGYKDYSIARNHSAGLRFLGEDAFTHVIVTALDTSMKVKDFLPEAQKLAPDTVFILSSYEPNVDDVFEMLTMGIKGILAKPFTVDSIAETINKASKDRKVNELVATAQSRNEAISALVLDKLDKAAAILKETPSTSQTSGVMKAFRSAMKPVTDVAERYSDGGMTKFQDSLISVSTHISEAEKQAERAALERLAAEPEEKTAAEPADTEEKEAPLSVAQLNARRRRKLDQIK